MFLIRLGHHIVHQCQECSKKGLICGICKTGRRLYPFEILKAKECRRCKNYFHKICLNKLNSRDDCPRCIENSISKALATK